MFLPFTFLKFWYIDATVEIVSFFASLNNYFMQLFALPLCLRTYFKPLKNEYREGLVGFSRAMGIVVKTVFIITDLFIFTFLLLFEGVVVISFLVFPVITILLVFF
jgi:hypothetical protein